MAKFGNIVASLENLSEDGALGATEAAIKNAEVATDVADGNAEIIKETANIDYMDVAIEGAQDAGDKIEDLLEAAEDTMKEGGMSDKDAKLMEISHESIMNSIGMSHRQGLTANPVSSLESYAEPRTRMSSTLVTIESLKESAKNIGTNIVRALKAALNVVVGFLLKLVKNRALLEKHVQNLIKAAESIEGKAEMKKKTFATGASALSVGGSASVATAKQILDSAAKLVTASTDLSAAIGKSGSESETVSAVKSAITGIGSGSGGNYGHLTGGRSVSVKEEGDSITVSIADGGKTAESIEAPSKADILALLRQALSVVQALRAYEKTQTKLKDAVNSVIARLGEVASVVRSKVGSEESKTKAGEAAKVKKQARIARSMLSKAGGSFPSAVFAAVKAVADYSAAGIRNLGAAAAGGAAPEAPTMSSSTALATR